MKPRKKNNVNKFFNLTGILFFGVFIFLVVGNVFHKDKTFSETENRMLAECPELSVDGFFREDLRVIMKPISMTSSFFGKPGCI